MLKKKELISCEYWQKAINFVIQKDQQLLANYNQHVTQTDKTGIIRHVSRMENMSNIENHQALLDRHSPIVSLLIFDFHNDALHAGPSINLTKFRYFKEEDFLLP